MFRDTERDGKRDAVNCTRVGPSIFCSEILITVIMKFTYIMGISLGRDCFSTKSSSLKTNSFTFAWGLSMPVA
jgi:hypothetical protein